MKCPRCDGTLKESKFESVSIDSCDKCGGIWLDRGEVPRLEALSAKLERPGSRMLRAMREIRAKGYTGF